MAEVQGRQQEHSAKIYEMNLDAQNEQKAANFEMQQAAMKARMDMQKLRTGAADRGAAGIADGSATGGSKGTDTVQAAGRAGVMVTRKTALTFEEKITAAHLYYVQGIDQHVIAFAMNVNMGRVNEACVKVGDVLGGRERCAT